MAFPALCSLCAHVCCVYPVIARAREACACRAAASESGAARVREISHFQFDEGARRHVQAQDQWLRERVLVKIEDKRLCKVSFYYNEYPNQARCSMCLMLA